MQGENSLQTFAEKTLRELGLSLQTIPPFILSFCGVCFHETHSTFQNYEAEEAAVCVGAGQQAVLSAPGLWAAGALIAHPFLHPGWAHLGLSSCSVLF